MSKFRHISNEDITSIVRELDKWAMGELGSKLTWQILVDKFGFSRQALQAKSEVKAAYDNAKQALSGGLVKSKKQTEDEYQKVLIELERTKIELENYKQKEQLWLRRWQQIAFNIRQKGIQISDIDKDTNYPDEDLPSKSETAKILRPFDKEIPPSGRV